MGNINFTEDISEDISPNYDEIYDEIYNNPSICICYSGGEERCCVCNSLKNILKNKNIF